MRYKITIEYDGTSLLGWQEQLDGPSVQNYLQRALSCFTPQEETNDAPLSDEEYEEAGTGRRLQKSDAFFNNDFSEAYAGGSTARRTAAYKGVREDASTGRRLQKTNKIMVPLSVYIHWPYCLSKSPYCDFFSKVDKHVDQKQIIDGYLDDLNWYHDLTAKQTVQSIFFGGGTPSLIEPQYIEKVINHIFKLWPTTKQVEISLEANPNTNRPNLFADLRLAGINRLSLGIQALNDKGL
mgnify:FL=1